MVHFTLILIQIFLLVFYVFCNPASNLFQRRLVSPITWPKLFYQQSQMNPNIRDSRIACGSSCISSPTFCNTFLLRDGECLLGRFPAPNLSIESQQTEKEIIFIEYGKTNCGTWKKRKKHVKNEKIMLFTITITITIKPQGENPPLCCRYFYVLFEYTFY